MLVVRGLIRVYMTSRRAGRSPFGTRGPLTCWEGSRPRLMICSTGVVIGTLSHCSRKTVTQRHHLPLAGR